MDCLCAAFAKVARLPRPLRLAMVAAAAAVALRCAATARQRHARQAMLRRLPRGRLTLFVFPRLAGQALGISAPCLKAETYLRLAGLPYDVVFTNDFDLSPTGCFPCLHHNGRLIADSGAIIRHVQTEFGVSDGLDAAQEVQALLMTRLVEESLKWHLSRAAWVDDIDAVLSAMDAYVRPIPTFAARLLFGRLRQKVIAKLNATGQGDLTDEQYHAEFDRDMAAIEALLPTGGDGFAMGPRPTAVDAVVFAYLHAALHFARHGCRCPAIDRLAGSGGMVDYVARVEQRAFPDKAELLRADAGRASYPGRS